MASCSRRIWIGISDPNSAWRKLIDSPMSSGAPVKPGGHSCHTLHLYIPCYPDPCLNVGQLMLWLQIQLLGLGDTSFFLVALVVGFNFSWVHQIFKTLHHGPQYHCSAIYVPLNLLVTACYCNSHPNCWRVPVNVVHWSQLATIHLVKLQIQKIPQEALVSHIYYLNSFDTSYCTIFFNKYSAYLVIEMPQQMLWVVTVTTVFQWTARSLSTGRRSLHQWHFSPGHQTTSFGINEWCAISLFRFLRAMFVYTLFACGLAFPSVEYINFVLGLFTFPALV